MGEIDTRPLESVQAALTLFEQRSDQSRLSSPDRNEPEIDAVTRELASCRVQLEVTENESKQAGVMIASLQKAMEELSERYDRACLDAYGRIAQLEADCGKMASQQSATATECCALRDELAVVRAELDAVKGANSYVLEEVETMETRRILEKESAREALGRILELNDAVLSSAAKAMGAEKERSVFFQEATLELFNSDRNLELIRRQQEMMTAVEEDVLAKTVVIEYLVSELKQLKELHVSSEPVANSEVSRTAAEHQEQGDRGDSAEIVTVECKDDGEFYTKEIGGPSTLDDGYVVLAKKAEADGKLDAAHAEISDLRFSLEVAVRRAELAEEGKAALERELRQEIQQKPRPPPRPRPRAVAWDWERRDGGACPAPPSRPPPVPTTPSPMPSPSCLTLGKALNMKFK